MDKFDFDHAGRCMRWYEWLAGLVLLAFVVGVKAAAPVYRCTDASGAVAFGDRPCAVAEHESVVEIAPAPTYAASPEYALPKAERATYGSRASGSRGRNAASSSAQSFECRAADGQVFYRHYGCPRSIAASEPGLHAAHAGKSPSSGKTVAVHATRVPREQACAQMRRAGAIGRSGHAHDEDVSSYDKNLGRDLCH